MRRGSLALLVLPLLAACGGSGQDEAAVRPDSVAMALEQYSPALFDTIQWSADSAKINRGGVVWAFSCKKCHGAEGLGDANMVVGTDTLRPPNFTTQWRFGSDKEQLLKYIYSGNDKAMPHWGIEGLKPRDIDAVAGYIMQNLIGAADTTAQAQTPTS